MKNEDKKEGQQGGQEERGSSLKNGRCYFWRAFTKWCLFKKGFVNLVCHPNKP